MLTTAQRDKTTVTVRATIGYYNSSTYSARVELSPVNGITATWQLGSLRRKNRRTVTRRLSDHHLQTVPRSFADEITRRVTALDSFQELINTEGGYTPTLFCDKVLNRVLANLYDTAQESRGDKNRRAHRVKVPESSSGYTHRTRIS